MLAQMLTRKCILCNRMHLWLLMKGRVFVLFCPLCD